MHFLSDDLENYIAQHSQAEPELLAALNRETHLKIMQPRMLSGHFQGRVLSMLSKIIRPNQILEIGTYTGYAALCLAEGLAPNGQLHTIELNDELSIIQQKYLKNEKGYELIVTNLEGNPSTGKKKGQIAAFDFAYIQFADKLDIGCLHFIMHDQLETIHDNQLNTIVEVANGINSQYIVPILRDKIPSNIDISEFEVLSLSQDDKLFKI